jgi:hypothetical protein
MSTLRRFHAIAPSLSQRDLASIHSLHCVNTQKRFKAAVPPPTARGLGEAEAGRRGASAAILFLRAPPYARSGDRASLECTNSAVIQTYVGRTMRAYKVIVADRPPRVWCP